MVSRARRLREQKRAIEKVTGARTPEFKKAWRRRKQIAPGMEIPEEAGIRAAAGMEQKTEYAVDGKKYIYDPHTRQLTGPAGYGVSTAFPEKELQTLAAKRYTVTKTAREQYAEWERKTRAKAVRREVVPTTYAEHLAKRREILARRRVTLPFEPTEKAPPVLTPKERERLEKFRAYPVPPPPKTWQERIAEVTTKRIIPEVTPKRAKAIKKAVYVSKFVGPLGAAEVGIAALYPRVAERRAEWEKEYIRGEITGLRERPVTAGAIFATTFFLPGALRLVGRGLEVARVTPALTGVLRKVSPAIVPTLKAKVVPHIPKALWGAYGIITAKEIAARPREEWAFALGEKTAVEIAPAIAGIALARKTMAVMETVRREATTRKIVRGLKDVVAKGGPKAERALQELKIIAATREGKHILTKTQIRQNIEDPSKVGVKRIPDKLRKLTVEFAKKHKLVFKGSFSQQTQLPKEFQREPLVKGTRILSRDVDLSTQISRLSGREKEAARRLLEEWKRVYPQLAKGYSIKGTSIVDASGHVVQIHPPIKMELGMRIRPPTKVGPYYVEDFLEGVQRKAYLALLSKYTIKEGKFVPKKLTLTEKSRMAVRIKKDFPDVKKAIQATHARIVKEEKAIFPLRKAPIVTRREELEFMVKKYFPRMQLIGKKGMVYITPTLYPKVPKPKVPVEVKYIPPPPILEARPSEYPKPELAIKEVKYPVIPKEKPITYPKAPTPVITKYPVPTPPIKVPKYPITRVPKEPEYPVITYPKVPEEPYPIKPRIPTLTYPIIKIPKPRVPPPAKPPIYYLPKKPKVPERVKELRRKAYIALIKRYGRWVKVTPPVTKETALGLGALRAVTGLGATFRVIPVRERPRKIRTADFARFRRMFREYRIRKGRRVPIEPMTYIQFREKRLAHPGEVREIIAARKAKVITKIRKKKKEIAKRIRKLAIAQTPFFKSSKSNMFKGGRQKWL